MTLDELRDWHARRAGWTYHPNLSGIGGGPNQHPATGAVWTRGNESVWVHPFPPTIDGAASAMPKGRTGARYMDYYNGWVWICGKASCYDTGNEIHDRYLLAKLAWEQETRNEGN